MGAVDALGIQNGQRIVSELGSGQGACRRRRAGEAAMVEGDAVEAVGEVGGLLKPDGGVAARAVGEQQRRAFAAGFVVNCGAC